MSGGLLPLVAFGSQNTLINGNPQITFFNKVFTRHTHFSMENITIPLEGPQELLLNAPIRLRAKIPRNADLLSGLYLTFELPEIYSKKYDDGYTPEFAWIRQIGAHIIDTVSIFVGGSKVQQFTGEWLAIRAQQDYDAQRYGKWRRMVGDSPELFDPANGLNASELGSYPSVVGAGPNNPSIQKQQINLPLHFWFMEHIGAALPLIALQYHEVEVQVILRPLSQLYTTKDANGLRVGYGYKSVVAAGDTLSASSGYATVQELRSLPQNFYVDNGFAVPATEYFSLNARLQGNYVYLTDTERQRIALKNIRYMVPQLQIFRDSINARSKIDLDAHSLVRRILWVLRRSDVVQFQNDYLNCTNWRLSTVKPYKKGADVPADTPNSGLLLPNSERSILRSARIYCSGNGIQEEKPASFFEDIQSWQHSQGGSARGTTQREGRDLVGPVYMQSFSLRSSDMVQPTGTINLSRINKFQLELDVFPLLQSSGFVYDVTVFAESLNFLEIASGMGGMKFAV